MLQEAEKPVRVVEGRPVFVPDGRKYLVIRDDHGSWRSLLNRQRFSVRKCAAVPGVASIEGLPVEPSDADDALLCCLKAMALDHSYSAVVNGSATHRSMP